MLVARGCRVDERKGTFDRFIRWSDGPSFSRMSNVDVGGGNDKGGV